MVEITIQTVKSEEEEEPESHSSFKINAIVASLPLSEYENMQWA